jgi:cytochrome c peroxidase
MNLGIRSLIIFFIIFFNISINASPEKLLKDAVLLNGFKSANEINPETNDELVMIGKNFFNSENISLNGDTSCQTCHLDKFGSADGIPNAVGVGGVGEGAERVKNYGAILPRNTLPLWGRGIENFDVLFWDGRVEKVEEYIFSQFGKDFPSNDPLIVAAHLPPVEIREMLVEDKFITDNKQERLNSAENVFSKLADKARLVEAEAMQNLADFHNINISDVTYFHIAESIAEFIREKFAVQQTKFHKFVFEDGSLTEDEFNGAMLFYGKGKCASCHSGPLLSDMQFHTIAFPQIGYGKNGFGIDYGKYNTSHNFPYSHSGSVADLEEAVVYHFDPLRFFDASESNELDRVEYYKRLSLATKSELLTVYLSKEEVDEIISFLKTLSFNPKDI